MTSSACYGSSWSVIVWCCWSALIVCLPGPERRSKARAAAADEDGRRRGRRRDRAADPRSRSQAGGGEAGAGRAGRQSAGLSSCWATPGRTKTSVMLHSGLEPELLAGQVYQNNAVAPTRTANFWFSRRAIFVEAGGKLLADVRQMEPADPEAAAAVVGGGQGRAGAARGGGLLRLRDLHASPARRTPPVAAARNLRARLGEISQAMGINLPVYVLFTQDRTACRSSRNTSAI